MSSINELESTLKTKYNDYIDALINYLNQLKTDAANSNTSLDFVENNATKYVLDNNISVGMRNSYEIVKAADTEKLAAKKID